MSGFAGNLPCNGVYCYRPTGGGLYVGECAASTREGPLRGVQPLTCGGGCPLYAGGGRTSRKGGVVLASATSFSPFSQLFREVVANLIISLSLSLRYIHIIYSLWCLGPHRAISFLLRRCAEEKYIYGIYYHHKGIAGIL